MKALLVALFLIVAGSAHAQAPSVTLDWTAVGDDSLTGTATAYQLRGSTTPPPASIDVSGREAWWIAATQYTTMPPPKPAGSAEAVTITPSGGFPAGTHYFVLRVRDEASNWSAWSNVASKSIPLVDVIRPAPITDLRTR